MRVLLINATPLDRLGGAELSLRYHRDHAPPGVRADVATPDPEVDLDLYDALVLANLRPHGETQPLPEHGWAEQWTQRLAGYGGCVIRSERDVHPCGMRDGRCLDLKRMKCLPCDCDRALTQAFQALYGACDAVHFLSPLHCRAIRMLIKVRAKQYVIAPPIALDRFRSVTPFSERKRAALIIGDAARVAPDAEQRAIDSGYTPERVEYLSVPYDEMPRLLNEYQAVVIAPVMLHAFARLAVEAMSCGCEVLTNERVGAMSWPDPLQACRESNARFWKMVTDAPRHPNRRRLRRGFFGMRG
jgi:glycosyltransferase involved in cell wall biosynthesis